MPGPQRTFKAFRLLARAVRRDPSSGIDLPLTQLESEPFKVRLMTLCVAGCGRFVLCW